MTDFPGRAVAFVRDEDLKTEALVLAENGDGSGRRLEIQRALSVDEEDRRLGLDTYCLVNERGMTYYGGIVDWRLQDDRREVTLAGEAAEALDADGGYIIRLVEPSFTREVEARLGAILGRRVDEA